MFHMYALDSPPPVTNCHAFSDPLPLERDVLYGRPLRTVTLVQCVLACYIVYVENGCLMQPINCKYHDIV